MYVDVLQLDGNGRHVLTRVQSIQVVIVPLDPAEDPPEETLMPQDTRSHAFNEGPFEDIFFPLQRLSQFAQFHDSSSDANHNLHRVLSAPSSFTLDT